MTDIPDDVMQAAREAHAKFADSRVTENLGDIIAQAILSERARHEAEKAEMAEEIARLRGTHETAIAEAVAAERKRCAEIAERHEQYYAARDNPSKPAASIGHASDIRLARAASPLKGGE